MKRIETERWIPSVDNPDKLVCDGSRPAQEIFQELYYRLICTGYLPDEYFLIDDKWKNGALYPEGGELYYSVNYGASEGIYLDIYINYKDDKGEWVKDKFATGKTLGESESDLDRMYLIASACTKAFHTDGLHARYIVLGKSSEPNSIVIHLSKDEIKFLIDSLIDVRSRAQEEDKPISMAEQLLRRIIGNITEYMEAVGEKPQNISPYDYTILCIRDSNIKGFLETYQKVPCEEYGKLLIRAARSPGRIGKTMTELILAGAKDIPCETYEQAFKSAINACDLERVLLLLEKAESVVKDLDVSMYGEIISHSEYPEERRGYTGNITLALLKKYTPEQASAIKPYILENAIASSKNDLVYELIHNGMPCKPDKAMFYAARGRNYQAFYMLRREIGEDVDYSGAFNHCMRWDNFDAARFLIDCGLSLENFKNSLNAETLSEKEKNYMDTITHYWEKKSEAK